MSVSVKYKGAEIAALSETGTKTLKTSGKYCEADIVVENTKDSGGSSGESRETWVWKYEDFDTVRLLPVTTISFISGGTTYTSIHREVDDYMSVVYYDTTEAIHGSTRQGVGANFADVQYRKITFLESPTGDLLTYLQANAVKQPSDVAVQTNKALTITSNGTTNITPDIPYDAMSKVAVTVNVPGIVWVDPD